MWTIHVDVPTTRRGRLNYVLDETEKVRWTSARIGPALEHLVENGQTEFKVQGLDRNYLLQIVPLIE